MRVEGKSFRTIWPEGGAVKIIDQTRLPHEFEILSIATVSEAARAIKNMQVRGAPLIGVTAAYGVALAMRADPSDANLDAACCPAGRGPADRCQFAMGDRGPCAPHLLALPPANAPRPVSPMPARSRNKMSAFAKRSASMGLP